MPNRAYRARHEPPSRLDHALAHPGNTVLGLWWVIMGTLVLVSAFVDGFYPSASIAHLSWWSTAIIGAFAILGGALVVWGTITTTEVLDRAWDALKAGVIVSGCAWIGYAALVIWNSPNAAVVWGNAIANTLFCAAVFLATFLEERRIRTCVQLEEEGEFDRDVKVAGSIDV